MDEVIILIGNLTPSKYPSLDKKKVISALEIAIKFEDLLEEKDLIIFNNDLEINELKEKMKNLFTTIDILHKIRITPI